MKYGCIFGCSDRKRQISHSHTQQMYVRQLFGPGYVDVIRYIHTICSIAESAAPTSRFSAMQCQTIRYNSQHIGLFGYYYIWGIDSCLQKVPQIHSDSLRIQSNLQSLHWTHSLIRYYSVNIFQLKSESIHIWYQWYFTKNGKKLSIFLVFTQFRKFMTNFHSKILKLFTAMFNATYIESKNIKLHHWSFLVVEMMSKSCCVFVLLIFTRERRDGDFSALNFTQYYKVNKTNWDWMECSLITYHGRTHTENTIHNKHQLKLRVPRERESNTAIERMTERERNWENGRTTNWLSESPDNIFWFHRCSFFCPILCVLCVLFCVLVLLVFCFVHPIRWYRLRLKMFVFGLKMHAA